MPSTDLTAQMLRPQHPRPVAQHAAPNWIGTAPITRQPFLVLTPPGDPFMWVVCRVDDDPRWRAFTLGMPREVRRHLLRLDRDGFEFPLLVIGHELEKSHGITDPVEALTHVASQPTRAERSAARLTSATALVTQLLRTIARVAEQVATATAMPMLADPVLIGVAPREDGRTADYFELARWRA